MRILLVLRLYSHLIPSILAGRWIPMGMPAVYKLIEGLNRRGIEADVLFLCKNYIEQIKQIHTYKFAGLDKIRFCVVPYRRYTIRIIEWAGNGLLHLIQVLKFIRNNRYDIIYCDKAHLAYAALLSWLKKKTVLRLHGVAILPETMNTLKERLIPFLRLCFSAPFAYVICSKDGSPGRYFMNKYIRKTVPTKLLFNGIDPLVERAPFKEGLRQKYKLSPETKIILATGKLEPDKASEVFIGAMSELKKLNSKFFVVVVGDGSLRSKLEAQIHRRSLSRSIIFTGRIPHRMIYSYLIQADIYVSLNLRGNLSNAVLEAMKAGKCIVTLKKCEVSLRDEHTEDKELEDALVLIDRDRISDSLPRILTDLITNPEIIKVKGDRIRRYADRTFKGWNERIDYEIDLMYRITNKKISEENSELRLNVYQQSNHGVVKWDFVDRLNSEEYIRSNKVP